MVKIYQQTVKYIKFSLNFISTLTISPISFVQFHQSLLYHNDFYLPHNNFSYLIIFSLFYCHFKPSSSFRFLPICEKCCQFSIPHNHILCSLITFIKSQQFFDSICQKNIKHVPKGYREGVKKNWKCHKHQKIWKVNNAKRSRNAKNDNNVQDIHKSFLWNVKICQDMSKRFYKMSKKS